MTYHVCRRLILFLDGTWNEESEDASATNIVFLRELLFWGIKNRLREAGTLQRKGEKNEDIKNYEKLTDATARKAISGVVLDGFEYLVYYDEGVGTRGFLDALKGGVMGDGLDANIREAYRFLSTWYRPGDEIFVFGFSRGAFTARSLCGIIQVVGLLQCEFCTQENEDRAWQYYRTPPEERLSGEWIYFRKKNNFGHALVHDEKYARVRALCVFDTVGALGIPTNFFQKINLLRYKFHNTELSSIIDIRLQALAIDEPRPEFEPSVWTNPKFKRVDNDKSPTEQVWFPGAHADIGGGYVNWVRHESGLSLLPLMWMKRRLNALLKITKPLADAVPFKTEIEPKQCRGLPFWQLEEEAALIDSTENGSAVRCKLYRAEQHKPWSMTKPIRDDVSRLINQLPLPASSSKYGDGRVKFADPIGEMVHVTALKRFNTKIDVEKNRVLDAFGTTTVYRPKNLIKVIPYLAASYIKNACADVAWKKYVKPIYPWRSFRIVDWDGEPLDPMCSMQVRRAFSLLPEPADVGITVILSQLNADGAKGELEKEMMPLFEKDVTQYVPLPTWRCRDKCGAGTPKHSCRYSEFRAPD